MSIRVRSAPTCSLARDLPASYAPESIAAETLLVRLVLRLYLQRDMVGALAFPLVVPVARVLALHLFPPL